jgi:hypothetical protein
MVAHWFWMELFSARSRMSLLIRKWSLSCHSAVIRHQRRLLETPKILIESTDIVWHIHYLVPRKIQTYFERTVTHSIFPYNHPESKSCNTFWPVQTIVLRCSKSLLLHWFRKSIPILPTWCTHWLLYFNVLVNTDCVIFFFKYVMFSLTAFYMHFEASSQTGRTYFIKPLTTILPTSSSWSIPILTDEAVATKWWLHNHYFHVMLKIHVKVCLKVAALITMPLIDRLVTCHRRWHIFSVSVNMMNLNKGNSLGVNMWDLYHWGHLLTYYFTKTKNIYFQKV